MAPKQENMCRWDSNYVTAAYVWGTRGFLPMAPKQKKVGRWKATYFTTAEPAWGVPGDSCPWHQKQ